MAEKTEQATPKKLRDARKKGQVAKSQDFPSAFTFIVSVSVVILSAGYLFEMLAAYIISMFKLSGTNIDMTNMASSLFTEAIMVIFNTSMPILVLTVIVGLLVNF